MAVFWLTGLLKAWSKKLYLKEFGQKESPILKWYNSKFSSPKNYQLMVLVIFSKL